MFDYKKESVIKEKGDGGYWMRSAIGGAGRGVVLWDWVTDGEKSQTQEANKALLRTEGASIKG